MARSSSVAADLDVTMFLHFLFAIIFDFVCANTLLPKRLTLQLWTLGWQSGNIGAVRGLPIDSYEGSLTAMRLSQLLQNSIWI